MAKTNQVSISYLDPSVQMWASASLFPNCTTTPGMKQLLSFRGFSNDPQGVLTAVYRPTLMDIELPLNGGLGIPHVGVSRELGITAFADSEHRGVPNTFHDPKTALWHTESVAHSDWGAYSLGK